MLWDTLFLEHAVAAADLCGILAELFVVPEGRVYFFGSIDELADAQLDAGQRVAGVVTETAGDFVRRVEVYCDADIEPDRLGAATIIAQRCGVRVLLPDPAPNSMWWALVDPEGNIQRVDIDEDLLAAENIVRIERVNE